MGRTDLENFPVSRSALRMLDDVSAGFYENSYVGKWLFQAMGLEYDDAFQLVEELPRQFFPETATWGLKYHEMKWQLPVRESLGHEERRRLIYQKRDYRAPMTPYRMENYLRNATGFDVRISDCHDPGEDGFQPDHPNVFRVDFTGAEILDTGRAKRMLDELKQSHTTYIMNAYTMRRVHETIYPGAAVAGYAKNQPVMEGHSAAWQDGELLYAGVSVCSTYKSRPALEGAAFSRQAECTGHVSATACSLRRQEIKSYEGVL